MKKAIKNALIGCAFAVSCSLIAAGGVLKNEAFAEESENAKVTVNETISFTTGASIRVDTEENGVTGVRYAANIPAELYNTVIENGKYKSETTELGMIIVPAKAFAMFAQKSTENDYFRYFASLDKSNAKENISSAIPVEKYNIKGDGYQVQGVIELKPENYNVEYQAAVYYTADGENYTYSPLSSSRSITYVAKEALNDKNSGLSNEQKAKLTEIVKNYATVVSVEGIAEYDGHWFSSIEEAYNTISPKVEALATFGNTCCSAEAFDAFYSQNGKITWNIYGKHEITSDPYTFSFGRQSSYYGDRNLTALEIIGQRKDAEIDLTNSVIDENRHSFSVPWNWQGEAIRNNTDLTVKNVILDNIQSMPSNAYATPTVAVKTVLEGCTINGWLYSYQNYLVNQTIKDCTFNATENGENYAFFAQGDESESTITLENNTFNGYKRGVNMQRKNTAFVLKNNTFVSENADENGYAIQITDGKSFEIVGNTVKINAGNALWYHSAATNAETTYTITDNDFSAPYLGSIEKDLTSSDGKSINERTTWARNKFNDTDLKHFHKGGVVGDSTIKFYAASATLETLKDSSKISRESLCAVPGEGTCAKRVLVTVTLGNEKASDIAYSEHATGYTGKGVQLGNTALNHYAASVPNAGDYTFVFNGGSITSAATGYTSIDNNPDDAVLMLLPANSNVIFNGVTFNNVLNFMAQKYTSPWAYLHSITFRNCTFNGIIIGTCPAVEANFENCVFKNYTNTASSNNSNPIWWRADSENNGQGRSMNKVSFIGNKVYSTRPVKFERIGFACNVEDKEYTAELIFKNNYFDIQPLDSDIETGKAKNFGIIFGQYNAESRLIITDENNEISENTAGLYAVTKNAQNGYFENSDVTILDGNGNAKELTVYIWKCAPDNPESLVIPKKEA